MPPVFGPWSPSSRRLWSWLVARAATFLPSHSTMKLASSPCRNSSITTRAPPSLCVTPSGLIVRRQHELDGLVRLVQAHGHHHALAGGQAVGLDHDGRALLVHIGVGRRRVGEGFVLGRRNAVALHEGLGEGLGAFQLRGGLGRAEHAQAVRAELVHHAGRQRLLGADHRQRDLFGQRPLAQRLHVGDGDVLQARVERGARRCRAPRTPPAPWGTAPVSRPARVHGHRRRSRELSFGNFHCLIVYSEMAAL